MISPPPVDSESHSISWGIYPSLSVEFRTDLCLWAWEEFLVKKQLGLP